MGGQHGLPAHPAPHPPKRPEEQGNLSSPSTTDAVNCTLSSDTPSDELPASLCSLLEMHCTIEQVAQCDTKLDVQCLAFDPDPRHLIVAGPSGFGMLEWRSGQLVSRTGMFLNSLPLCIALCPHSHSAVCGLKDGTLAYSKCLFPPGTKAPQRILAGHRAPVAGVCVTPDGRLAVSAAETVRAWRLEEHTPEQEDAAMQAFGVSTVPRGYDREAAAAPSGRSVQLRGYCFATLPCEEAAAFACVSIAPRGFSVAAGCGDGSLYMWSTICEEIAHVFALALARGAKTHPWYRVDSQSMRLVLQGYLRGPRPHQYRRPHVVAAHTAAVCALAFTPSGNHLLTSGRDHRLRIWRTDSRLDAASIQVGAPVHTICVSHSHLALCATETVLYICDPFNTTMISSFHVSPCVSVALSADSRHVAVVGRRVLGSQVTVYQIAPHKGAGQALLHRGCPDPYR